MRGRALTVSAPAKFNLYLGVSTQLDQRGYHKVDSVMAAVDLFDEVTVAPASQLSVATDPATDCPQQKNTAYRAAMALGKAFDREPNVAVSIRKRIPLCAGLGGPSTDAAAVLRALCCLWDIDVADPLVAEVARGIGADVPFFLYDSPAYLSGGGDVLQETFPSIDGLPVCLVKPIDARVSTVDAYRAFDADPVAVPPLDPLLQALRAGNAAAALPHIANNLGVVSQALEPQIAHVLAFLRVAGGVVAADVCGSGACSFAVCDSHETARGLAAEAASRHGWWSAAVRTCGAAHCSEK